MRSLIDGQWSCAGWSVPPPWARRRPAGSDATEGRHPSQPEWHSCLACILALGLVSIPAEPPPSALALDKAFADLKNGDWILKSAAMSQLAKWNIDEAEKPIRAILIGKEHPWLRGRALVALARTKGAALLNDAIAFFDAKHPVQLRNAAIESLGIIGKVAGEATILKAMKDEDVSIRRTAIVSLARLKGKGAWDSVSAAMEDEDKEIVRAAVRSLQYINTGEARNALLELLQHDLWDVRFEAAKAIRAARFKQAIQALFEGMAKDRDHRVKKACEQALIEFEPDALATPMIEKLVGEDKSYYSTCLKLLQLMPSTKGCDALAKILKSQDKRYQPYLTTSFSLLANFDPDAYHEVFITYLSHQDRNIRQYAISSLGKCKTTDIYTSLRPLLNDNDRHIRHHTLNVARSSKGPLPESGIISFVAPHLTSQDSHIRHYTLDLLRRHIKPDEFEAALEALTYMLNSPDKNLRNTARKILLPISDDDGRTRMAKAQGILTHWMLLASFPTPQQTEDTEEEAQPKTEVDQVELPTPSNFNFKQEYKDTDEDAEGNIKWQPHTITNQEFRVPLHELYFPPTTENKTAFAVADFLSEADEAVKLLIYADDSHTLWLNGKQLSEQKTAGEHTVDANIVKGSNRIFVRVGNVKEWWWLTVKIASKTGQVMESVTQKSAR
ncbi:MAG: HEAT repeat domain-containing protein [Planctomycetota bacterium]|jgi:HEAT repeat protein|nr:HEAT repeat domain-containing protein [Planctomycetota bacterium]